MVPIVPNPARVRSFRSEAAFEKWMAANHAREDEIWLKVHKKDSGLPSVTCAQALDVALCWGWIDGIRKSFDEQSFLQRYTPRRARSMWSQVNGSAMRHLFPPSEASSTMICAKRVPGSSGSSRNRTGALAMSIWQGHQ
jgi:uncharacterized protein YdeI (YjbR/CyaY-like superfamily)